MQQIKAAAQKKKNDVHPGKTQISLRSLIRTAVCSIES